MRVASWIPKDREKRRSIKFGPNAPVPPHRRTGEERGGEKRRKEGEGEFQGGKETEGWPRGKKLDYGFKADKLDLL